MEPLDLEDKPPGCVMARVAAAAMHRPGSGVWAGHGVPCWVGQMRVAMIDVRALSDFGGQRGAAQG